MWSEWARPSRSCASPPSARHALLSSLTACLARVSESSLPVPCLQEYRLHSLDKVMSYALTAIKADQDDGDAHAMLAYVLKHLKRVSLA